MVAFWMNVHQPPTVLKMPLALILLTALSVSVPLDSWVMEQRVEMVAFWMNARPSQTVLKMPLVLTLPMDLSVSVPLDSWAMEQ